MSHTHIFPNPLFDILHINTEEKDNHNIQIFNSLGQSVLTDIMTNANYASINVEMMPKGIYYITIMNENAHINTEKFIKQ